jgi:hypothetical protein
MTAKSGDGTGGPIAAFWAGEAPWELPSRYPGRPDPRRVFAPHSPTPRSTTTHQTVSVFRMLWQPQMSEGLSDWSWRGRGGCWRRTTDDHGIFRTGGESDKHRDHDQHRHRRLRHVLSSLLLTAYDGRREHMECQSHKLLTNHYPHRLVTWRVTACPEHLAEIVSRPHVGRARPSVGVSRFM